MIEPGNESATGNDDAVEALLGKAAPRLAPPAEDAAVVREAVQAEWRKVSGRRRRQRRAFSMAIAASVLFAAFLSLNLLRTSGIEPVTVASIDKQLGSVRITGDAAVGEGASGLSPLVAGNSIVTGADSGVSLKWYTGGSLRVDAETQIEFRSPTELFVVRGRVYYDSSPAMAAISGATRQLVVSTNFGDVTHIGTQFMVQSDRSEMSVSVRKGTVEVTPDGGTTTRATDSQLVRVRGGAPEIVNFRPYGDAWEWLEATAPSVNLEGRSVDEFLTWVGHETGMAIHYESAGVRSAAQQEILRGQSLDASPRESLAIWLPAINLSWRMDEGVIYVDAR